MQQLGRTTPSAEAPKSLVGGIWAVRNRLSLVVLTTVATFLGTQFGEPVFLSLVGPPTRVVSQLMDDEIQAAQHRDTALIERIYATNAVVTDQGCYSGHPTTFEGLDQITARYQDLPAFVTLQHINRNFQWNGNWMLTATQATATAETLGVLTVPSGDGSRQNQTDVGNEAWRFARFGGPFSGQWKVTAFSYNLCFT